MKNARPTISMALGAMVLGAGLLSAGCGTDTCTAGDDACILAHLRVYDKGGNPVALTRVPGSAVKPMTRTGPGGSVGTDGGTGTGGSAGTGGGTGTGGSAGGVPVVTGLPSSATFFGASTYLELTLQFTDPCGDVPAGCFSVHHASPFPGSWMTTGPVYDSATQGQWPLQVGFDYTTTVTDTFTLDFVAWSSCGSPPQNPIEAFESGDSVAIGALQQVAVTDEAPAASSGTSGSGGGGGTCQSGDYCYCWSCNGDEECLTTNFAGTPSGCADEGSDSTCGGLLQFAQSFWGSAATYSCTQTP